ncbi:MAG: HEAT repeat domain-containing protein [Dehalococcoidales bacterium]
MLEAIYIIVFLQLLILVAGPYLVLRRWIVSLIERYTDRRKLRFEPYVFNLLNDPTATEPLEGGLFPGDRRFIKELLLQQAAQLKGQDRRNMTTVFEKVGYVKSEINALRSKRWWRRLEAAISLGIMQSQIAVTALINAVGDPVEDVRLAAVRALGQLNEPRGLRLLLDAIEEGERWTGSSIVEVIIGMGSEVSREVVNRLKSTTNANARLLYIQLCGFLRITAALSSLLLLLRDTDKETRVSAAKALGQIEDVTAVESLIISLSDESWEVRAQAAKSLGTLGDKQAVGKLKRALSDENWSVRHNAADALYRLGEEGIEALHETLRLSEGVPRTVAAQILAERALGV